MRQQTTAHYKQTNKHRYHAQQSNGHTGGRTVVAGDALAHRGERERERERETANTNSNNCARNGEPEWLLLTARGAKHTHDTCNGEWGARESQYT